MCSIFCSRATELLTDPRYLFPTIGTLFPLIRSDDKIQIVTAIWIIVIILACSIIKNWRYLLKQLGPILLLMLRVIIASKDIIVRLIYKSKIFVVRK